MELDFKLEHDQLTTSPEESFLLGTITTGEEKVDGAVLLVLLDTSRSMDHRQPELETVDDFYRSRIEVIKVALFELLDEANENDLVGLITFDNDAETIFEIEHATAENKNYWREAINENIEFAGQTNLEKGIRSAVNELEYVESFLQKDSAVIVIICDGYITSGVGYPRSRNQVNVAHQNLISLIRRQLEQLENMNVSIHSCGIGNEFDRRFLQRISSDCGSGGRFQGFVLPEEQLKTSSGFLSTLLQNERRTLKGKTGVYYTLTAEPGTTLAIRTATEAYDPSCLEIEELETGKYKITPKKQFVHRKVLFTMVVLLEEVVTPNQNHKVARFYSSTDSHTKYVFVDRCDTRTQNTKRNIRRRAVEKQNSLATELEDLSKQTDQEQVENIDESHRKLIDFKQSLQSVFNLACTFGQDPPSTNQLLQISLILEKVLKAVTDAMSEIQTGITSLRQSVLGFRLGSLFATFADILRTQMPSTFVFAYTEDSEEDVEVSLRKQISDAEKEIQRLEELGRVHGFDENQFSIAECHARLKRIEERKMELQKELREIGLLREPSSQISRRSSSGSQPRRSISRFFPRILRRQEEPSTRSSADGSSRTSSDSFDAQE